MDYISVILFYAAVILIVIFIVKMVRKRKENKEEAKKHPKNDSQKELVRDVIAAIERDGSGFDKAHVDISNSVALVLLHILPKPHRVSIHQVSIIMMNTVILSAKRWHIFWPVKLLITLEANTVLIITAIILKARASLPLNANGNRSESLSGSA